MFTRALRTEGDYNRGLPAPIRWSRLAAAALVAPIRPVWAWSGQAHRRYWARPGLVGLAAVAALWPVDAHLFSLLTSWEAHLPGDIRRELSALQQFGQGGTTILTMLVILSLDRSGARRLWDWLAGIGITAAAVYPLKMLLGRPRPGLDAEAALLPPTSALEGTSGTDLQLYAPDTFLGPWGVHPFPEPVGFRHAWEFWAGISADLWSMPSAHTAYAVVMAVFLGTSYPRVAWLVWILAGLVGVARVIFGAHYPTDVAAGAAIGAAAALAAVRGRLGQRLLRLDHRSLPSPLR